MDSSAFYVVVWHIIFRCNWWISLWCRLIYLWTSPGSARSLHWWFDVVRKYIPSDGRQVGIHPILLFVYSKVDGFLHYVTRHKDNWLCSDYFTDRWIFDFRAMFWTNGTGGRTDNDTHWPPCNWTVVQQERYTGALWYHIITSLLSCLFKVRIRNEVIVMAKSGWGKKADQLLRRIYWVLAIISFFACLVVISHECVLKRVRAESRLTACADLLDKLKQQHMEPPMVGHVLTVWNRSRGVCFSTKTACHPQWF